MPALQEAFYIIAIVFMGVIFLILIVLLVAVIKIRNKVNNIQRAIEEKINTVTSIAEKGGEIAALATGGLVRKAKKAVSKSR
jgi:Na+-transporting methylmalonyl-CoA/oxaloacetate decarboxylase gamma subunit